MSGDRPSDPFGGGGEEPGERSMSFLAATGFSLATTFFFFFLVAFIVSLRPAAATDLVTKFGCQAVATLLALFFILRLYAPDQSIRDVLGIRPTHFAFFPLAALLGAVVQIPANGVYDLISRRFPPAEPREQALQEELAGGIPTRILFFVILALAGPLLEEVFFRGALFRPLRRRYDAVSVVALTSVLFALAHLEWQIMVPIGLVGVSLGVLRSASGSDRLDKAALDWARRERFNAGTIDGKSAAMCDYSLAYEWRLPN